MYNCSCSCRNSCGALAIIASIIIGVVATVLRITAVITVTPAFLWTTFGIAVGYLASKQNSVAIPRTKNMESVATIPNPEPESLYSVYFLYAADGDKSDICICG